MAVEAIILKYSFLNHATWVVPLARPGQNCILKRAHKYLSIARVHFGLAVQQAVSILPLLELSLRNVAAVTIELYLVIVQLDFTFSDHELVGVWILPPAAAHIAKLLEILAIFNFNEFLDTSYAKIILEFEIAFLLYFSEVKLTLLESLEKEVVRVFLLKEVYHRPIEDFLDLLKFIHGLLSKQVFINAPVF